MKHRILIVEDNILLAGQQKKWFEKSGYEAVTTIDEPGARRLLKKEPFDLVLSDVRLPQGDGISLLEWMQRERIDVPFIIMTGYASVSDAVRAIKMGAKDYLAKPVQMDELQSLIKNILHPRSVIYGKDKGILPRNSRQMKEVENLARTVAPFDISVLILGPNGAGKESVAQRIHYSSERREKPFLAVNCGVIPKELAPSLFFGHVKGTFTGADTNREGFFETARGGTLFLDEVGTLSMEVQSMLLRTLQEGSYIPIGSNREKHSDVRIVAATNEDLQLAIRERRFREDLYHRLNILELTIPPLRDRVGDIPLLARHFIELHAGAKRGREIQISNELYRAFGLYPWHGNIRELKNVITYALFNLEEDEKVLSTRHLPERFFRELLTEQPEIKEKELCPDNLNLDEVGAQAERKALLLALSSTKYNKTLTARVLGISRNKLYKKMRDFNLLSPSGKNVGNL